MGNYFMKMTSQSFPCQLCADIFQRTLEGSLLCPSCRIANDFSHLDTQQQNSIVSSCIHFPIYSIIKNKTPPILVIKSEFQPEFIQNLKSEIKILSINQVTRKYYKLIKAILKYLYQENYLSDGKFKGIYFHTMKSNDILFIHHPEIQNKERIVHVDLDELTKQIESEMNNQ